jgi:hypothetical protein
MKASIRNVYERHPRSTWRLTDIDVTTKDPSGASRLPPQHRLVGKYGPMTDGLIVAHDLVVAMDYGHFLLRGASANYYPDDLTLLDEALGDGQGVAADGRTVVVRSPHQNNFEMPLRVEVWDRTPPDDLDEWDEAFEGPLEVDSAGELSFDSPTLLQVRCVVPPGRYRILVVGRGIVAAGWPGSTKPGDSWRVQLSPADGDVPLRRLRSWDPAWQPSDRKATASVGAVATHPWTRRLRTELLAQSPGDPCCRRAESAILLRLMRDIPDAENVVVADQGQIESRLEMLLGDEVERPGLATELGLVDISGRRVRGLPARLMFGERHCVTAVWHGALSVGGQLTFQAKRLQALTWCPNVETALFLVGVGRRIGLPEMTIREQTAYGHPKFLSKTDPPCWGSSAQIKPWRRGASTTPDPPASRPCGEAA